MVDQPQEPDVVATEDVSDEDDFDYGPPRGTVAFVALMLIVYVIYYAVMYFEVFILRS